MNGGVYSRGKPVAKLPHGLRRRKKHVVDHYGGKGDIRAVLWSPPVNEFSFGERKSNPQVGTPPLDHAEKVLKSADIRTNRVRADCYGEVVDIGNRQTLGDSGVEAGYLKHKKKRRNGRALRGANRDRAENYRRTLENMLALVFREERLDPGNQIGGDSPFGEGIGQLVRAAIVKTSFDVQEKS